MLGRDRESPGTYSSGAGPFIRVRIGKGPVTRPSTCATVKTGNEASSCARSEVREKKSVVPRDHRPLMADFTLGTIASIDVIGARGTPGQVKRVEYFHVRHERTGTEQNSPDTRMAAVSNLTGRASTAGVYDGRPEMCLRHCFHRATPRDSADSKAVLPCRLATIDVKRR